MIERELTIAQVAHPLNIDGDAWLRVDHPVLSPLTDGNPTLGWEGDPRLVVYLHGESKRFVLWRLEADGEYRTVAALPEGACLTPENTNRLCARLVEIDQRRGFDPYQDVVQAQDAHDRAADASREAWVSQFADKLLFGLARSHLPGVDIAKRTFTGFGG